MATPDKMLLIDAAEYQAKEIARIANVPAYLVSVSIGNYSYVSSAEASRDLYTFGVKPYIDCIQETLSANNVLPRGTVVRFDIESYLEQQEKMQPEEAEEETVDINND
jgi:phage portal protein BeeE